MIGSRPDRVLVMCTANRCRSPLAAALLRREVAERGLPVEVLSAGLEAAGLPATPPTVAAAAAVGIDLSGHVSRTVTPALLGGADIVLGMERLHVREASVLEPSSWRYAFTLREVVRRAEAVEVRPDDEPMRVWCSILGAGRERQAMMGSSDADDVRDPTTDLMVDHPTTVAELTDLVRRFTDRAWP